MGSDNPPGRPPGGWFRVANDAHTHPKIVGLRNDSVRWAWFRALSAGKHQPGATGRWINVAHLADSMGRYGRYVAELVEAGLVDVDPRTGAVAIHDWDVMQTAIDPKAAIRQAQLRDRQRAEVEALRAEVARLRGGRNGVPAVPIELGRSVTHGVTNGPTETDSESENETSSPADAASRTASRRRLAGEMDAAGNLPESLRHYIDGSQDPDDAG